MNAFVSVLTLTVSPCHRPSLLQKHMGTTSTPTGSDAIKMGGAVSVGRNFFAAYTLPVLASLSHMYSMYEKSGGDRFS